MLKESRRETAYFEQLEPRILLSANPVSEVSAYSAAIQVDVQSDVENETMEVTEVLFVDERVTGADVLLENLNRNVEVVVIDFKSDGLVQISD